MFIHSSEYRNIELRARQLRAEALRDFLSKIVAKFRSEPNLQNAKAV